MEAEAEAVVAELITVTTYLTLAHTLLIIQITTFTLKGAGAVVDKAQVVTEVLAALVIVLMLMVITAIIAEHLLVAQVVRTVVLVVQERASRAAQAEQADTAVAITILALEAVTVMVDLVQQVVAQAQAPERLAHTEHQV